MPIQRVFLDWQRPALAVAAEWLISFARRSGPADSADLRQAIVVVPGRRAGRRLLELLVQQADEAGVVLSPPQILTEGSFPEQLYTPQKPFANRLTQQLAWAKALQETPAAVRKKILPQAPPKEDVQRWLALGDSLRKQHLGLAADGYDFADVAKKGAELPGFDERPRWEALATVQERYHKLLDAEKLWDAQSARLVAIERREIQTTQPIFLLSTVDLNQALRQMLDQVAGHVTALIAAPECLADAFDEHGCLRIDLWHDRQVRFVDFNKYTAHSRA
jgi:ATP-dependent helicase/nuclease subunit B